MLQVATGNHIGQGGQYMLGSYDSLYVAEGAVVADTEELGTTNWAIVALGSDQTIEINGQVVSYSWGVKIIQANAGDGNEHVEIGTEGTVFSKNNFAIHITSDASAVSNSGRITGLAGISTTSVDAPGLSEVTNRGTIDVTNNAVVYGGPEAYELTNKGLIASAHSASFFGLFAADTVTIHNQGTMEGLIEFGSFNDTYDGRGGKIDGVIYGLGGNDTFFGGAGTEQFVGGSGRDILTGGGGADEFIYSGVLDSTVAKAQRDLIEDFSHKQHDRMDLSAIDASSVKGGNEAFHFIGTEAFDGKDGELRTHDNSGHTFVYGDTDGDKHADFAIELAGHVALVKADFIL